MRINIYYLFITCKREAGRIESWAHVYLRTLVPTQTDEYMSQSLLFLHYLMNEVLYSLIKPSFHCSYMCT